MEKIKGRFLIGTAFSNDTSFTNEFKISSIDLRQTGKYLFRFYTLILCNSEWEICSNSSILDFMSFNIIDGHEITTKRFNLTNIGTQRVWIEQSLIYTPTSPKIDVITLFETLILNRNKTLLFD